MATRDWPGPSHQPEEEQLQRICFPAPCQELYDPATKLKNPLPSAEGPRAAVLCKQPWGSFMTNFSTQTNNVQSFNWLLWWSDCVTFNSLTNQNQSKSILQICYRTLYTTRNQPASDIFKRKRKNTLTFLFWKKHNKKRGQSSQWQECCKCPFSAKPDEPKRKRWMKNNAQSKNNNKICSQSMAWVQEVYYSLCMWHLPPAFWTELEIRQIEQSESQNICIQQQPILRMIVPGSM